MKRGRVPGDFGGTDRIGEGKARDKEDKNKRSTHHNGDCAVVSLQPSAHVQVHKYLSTFLGESLDGPIASLTRGEATFSAASR
jgi:hypothetical protein